MSKFLSIHCTKYLEKQICRYIKNEFLDVVAKFDYTIFNLFEPEEQHTINGVNVNIDSTRSFTLSKVFECQEEGNAMFNDIYSSLDYERQRQKHKFEICVTLKVLDSTARSFVITYNSFSQYKSNSKIFILYVGDKKYMINGEFYNKPDFEAYVFQQSTVDKDDDFGLDYILQIIQSVRL